MKLSRAVKIKMAGKGSVQSIYSRGISYTLTSREIHDKYLDWKNSLPKGTPQWVLFYFDGVSDCLHDNLYQHLHFAYIINGKLYSVHKDHADYYEKHGFKPSDLSDKKGGHYWRKNNKPFFIR